MMSNKPQISLFYINCTVTFSNREIGHIRSLPPSGDHVEAFNLRLTFIPDFGLDDGFISFSNASLAVTEFGRTLQGCSLSPSWFA